MQKQLIVDFTMEYYKFRHYLGNKKSSSELIDYIKKHDKDFIPPISKKVDIENYANKLNKLANNIICFDQKEIVGVCCFYCQPEQYDFAYLSYLSVDKNHGSKGIAKKLLTQMINICKNSGMKGIKTSTWEGNKAINIYQSFGFRIIESSIKSRVELLLVFE